MKKIKAFKICICLILILSNLNCSKFRFKNFPTISSLQKLELSNDTIYIDFKLDIPSKILHKKLSYEFIPYLILNKVDTINLNTKQIFGEKIERHPSVVYKYGGEFIHSATIAYTPKIESIRIMHKSLLTVYDKQVSINLPDNLIFEGKIGK